jgi:hypothetical protein
MTFYANDESDDIPASPPEEVYAAMAAAARAYRTLAENDRRVHFELDPTTGRVTIDLRDLRCRSLGALRAAEALDLSSGGSLPPRFTRRPTP